MHLILSWFLRKFFKLWPITRLRIKSILLSCSRDWCMLLITSMSTFFSWYLWRSSNSAAFSSIVYEEEVASCSRWGLFSECEFKRGELVDGLEGFSVEWGDRFVEFGTSFLEYLIISSCAISDRKLEPWVDLCAPSVEKIKRRKS